MPLGLHEEGHLAQGRSSWAGAGQMGMGGLEDPAPSNFSSTQPETHH